MILILGRSSVDPSTEYVIDELLAAKADFTRINGHDLLDNEYLKISDNTFEIKIDNESVVINSKVVKTVWFRRWMQYDIFPMVSFQHQPLHLTNDVNDHRINEFKASSIAFLNCIRDKKMLGLSNLIQREVSKIEQLEIAKEIGLKIPNYLVTNTKKELLNFYHENSKRIICKNIGNGSGVIVDGQSFGFYTSLIDDEMMSAIPDKFFPSLFQVFLEKEVELRIFYLDRRCYTMAIFSTLDQQTAVDFRRYNNKKPNRTVPFNLPDEVAIKIIKLMENLGLKTGSLDVILTKNNEFIFLEVNPNGQFGMVSHPCNYNLERKIAEYLQRSDL